MLDDLFIYLQASQAGVETAYVYGGLLFYIMLGIAFVAGVIYSLSPKKGCEGENCPNDEMHPIFYLFSVPFISLLISFYNYFQDDPYHHAIYAMMFLFFLIFFLGAVIASFTINRFCSQEKPHWILNGFCYTVITFTSIVFSDIVLSMMFG